MRKGTFMMFNPYTIILVLFILSGLIASLWGWKIIAQGKKTLHWPTTQGMIQTSSANTRHGDLLPHIEFRYSVDGVEHQCPVTFSGDITPSEEFCNSYLTKYPHGKEVLVYYDPANADNATLEPGVNQGDSIVFVIGAITLLLGIIFLFV